MIQIEELMQGCFKRMARKDYPCRGNGAASDTARKHHSQCSGIRDGDMYMEFEPGPHSSGSRHCLLCAFEFFR